jgi:hypothetical protein
MEDFNEHESRRALTAELEVQKNYLELVPRPSEEDYQRLKESIERDGFDYAKPIVTTEDLVVLDGHTRLQIALELGLDWVYVIIKDLADHYAEKRYIIEKNLDQRHLTPYQRGELGLKLLEIEQAEARERQRQSGINYKVNLNNQDSNLCKPAPALAELDKVSDAPHRLCQNSDKAGGRADELVASQVGVSRDTLYRVQKIKEAAQTDPEIAKARDKALAGKATVNQVYQQVREKHDTTGKKPKKPKEPPLWQPTMEDVLAGLDKKTHFELMMEDVPDPEPFPDDELMRAVYHVAELKGISREAIDGGIEYEKVHGPGPVGYSNIMARWRWWSQDLFEADLAWDMMMNWVERWQKEQRAARPEEVPMPDTSKKLGLWSLDFVHQSGLTDLVREFPAGSAHLIYSDALLDDLDQLSLLVEFSARALTAGKYLCVYADKRQLPEAMARLSAAGLTYFWSCMVFRPDAHEVAELKIKEIWRLMLIYQKGETLSPGWDWFYDSVKSLRPTNRDMVRQLIKGLTNKGQMVVDPLVGSGVTAQAARSLGRRFLCFGANEEDVRAANQRIAEVRLVEETGSETPSL